MIRNVLSSLSFSVVLGAGLTACGGAQSSEPVDSSSQQIVSDSADAEDSVDASTSLGDVVYLSAISIDPVASAASVAGDVGDLRLSPAGCVTRVKDASDPSVVHVTFHDCTGRHGLIHLSGEMRVMFSANQNGTLHVEKIGIDLTANGHALTHHVEADVTIDGDKRQIAWQGEWAFTNGFGRNVSHASNLQIQVDRGADCRTRSGTATTKIGLREVDSTFTDLKICDLPNDTLECPTGEVTHDHKLSGKDVSVTFDGSDEAKVELDGKSFERSISCTPAGS